MNLTAFLRLFRILLVFTRYRLDQLIQPLPLPWYGRLMLLGPWRLCPAPNGLTRGLGLRPALDGLAPEFVKLAPIRSARTDRLPGPAALALPAPLHCGQPSPR